MTEELAAKLARLKNYSTRYEITAERDGVRILIGYMSRRGRAGILSMVRANADKFLEFFECGASMWTWGKRASDGATINGWMINFSGRTQRDAYTQGELPFFCDLLRQRAQVAA
jgi:hypothetical protein